MIGKISKGRGFGGTCRYLLDPTKKPKIIGTNIFSAHRSPTSIAMEFRTWASVRPSVRRPVVHFPIAFAPEDGELDASVKVMISMEFLEKMGYGNCQYLIVEHSRNDPDHPKDHDHDHLHILTTAVDFDERRVPDSFDRYKIQTVMRGIEADYGLRRMNCSWERGIQLQPDTKQVKERIEQTLEDRPTLKAWIDRLEQDGISVRFNLSKTDRVQGIAYVVDDLAHEGRNLEMSWPVVKKQISRSAEDLELMKLANQRTQKAKVTMSQDEYQNFRKAESYAIALLQGKDEFDNSRLLITDDLDGLKVVRKRPHKLMIASLEGKAIGFPNLNQKDIDLMVSVAKRLGVALDEEAIYIQPVIQQQEQAIDDWAIDL
jgi:hypothetical protein